MRKDEGVKQPSGPFVRRLSEGCREKNEVRGLLPLATFLQIFVRDASVPPMYNKNKTGEKTVRNKGTIYCKNAQGVALIRVSIPSWYDGDHFEFARKVASRSILAPAITTYSKGKGPDDDAGASLCE